MKIPFKILTPFVEILVVLLAVACKPTEPKKETVTQSTETIVESSVKDVSYTVITTLPHDANAFTEGFLFHNNQLFESTGATAELPQTRSLFGVVDIKTGKIDTKAELDKTIYFGEGIAVLNNKFYQVTYKNQQGFIYDAKSFKKIGQFNYANKEGWGLTTDGTSIIMSDGTENLTYFNTNGMTVAKTLVVVNNGYIEEYLNELEFINGFIYANVWLKNYIVKIDPSTGFVVGMINLENIMAKEKSTNPTAKEMNGIAFNKNDNTILITGKMWQHSYQIDFVH